ncbi:MAG: hypothetical protein B7X78_07120 [Sphingomonadales bacterium 39-62-4]|jgi:hypothetical protein|nr:MAG: hypothetical protein B7X78_07120 [Sphingomonadales bacterium 39-62-4]
MSILCNVSEDTLDLMTAMLKGGQEVMNTKGADQSVDFSGSRVSSASRSAQTSAGLITVACKHGTITVYDHKPDGTVTTIKNTCTVESDIPYKEQMNQGLAEMLEWVTAARSADRDVALAKVQRMEEVLDAATAWLTTKGSENGLITVDAAFPKRPGQCYITFAFRQIAENLMQWAGSELPELTEIIESRIALEHKINIQPANRYRRTPMPPLDVLRSIKHLPEHLLV